MKTRIMFVCHGNICRSPMAEFIFKKMLCEEGIADKFTVKSSATSEEEIGNPIYPPAMRELKKHGISPTGKTANRLERADYEKYDLFLGMDSANLRNMNRIFGSDTENKIKKLMSVKGSPADVADPWYTGDFSKTYEDICSACSSLLELIKANKI